ncbi:MAG: OsmC family protein [Chitinophagales bacterium]
MKKHHYNIKTTWTGNEGKGTSHYKAYNRNHTILGSEKKIPILASSDPSFLGDKTKYNPEELFVSSISACHMLWYLHLCASNKIIVTKYIDNATGMMQELKNGSGKFESVVLHPIVTVANEKMKEKALALHNEAHKMCFIVNSCNFGITHQATIICMKENLKTKA